MPKKKIADSVSASENSAVATPKKANAPRTSSTAVTHKHKKAFAAGAESAVEVVSSAPAAPVVVSPTEEEIAIRAYLIAESRGFQGSPEDDWCQAERELLAERRPEIA